MKDIKNKLFLIYEGTKDEKIILAFITGTIEGAKLFFAKYIQELDKNKYYELRVLPTEKKIGIYVIRNNIYKESPKEIYEKCEKARYEKGKEQIKTLFDGEEIK